MVNIYCNLRVISNFNLNMAFTNILCYNTLDLIVKKERKMGAYIQYIYFLPIVLMLVMIFYSSNKRKKEQEKLISSFKVGDKVVTIGGIKGTIASVNETTIEIKVDSNTKLTLIKSAISRKEQ